MSGAHKKLPSVFPGRERTETPSNRKHTAEPPFQRTALCLKRQQLILEHEEIGLRIAQCFLARWACRLRSDDVQSIVSLALCEAALRFDFKRGVRFSTFLFLYIRGSLLKEIDSLASHCRRFVLRDTWNEEEQQEEDGGGPHDNLEQSESRRMFEKVMGLLPHEEQTVLKRHFYDDVPIATIAKELGYSRGHTSRLKRFALDMLTQGLQRHELRQQAG